MRKARNERRFQSWNNRNSWWRPSQEPRVQSVMDAQVSLSSMRTACAALSRTISMGCSTGHLQCQCEAVFSSPGIYYAPSTSQSVITPAPAPISTFCNSYSRATVRPGFESVSLVLGSNLITVIGDHRIRLFWNPMGTSQIISRLRGDNWETFVFCDLRCLVSELSFVTMR